jgi:hypothetical protein
MIPGNEELGKFEEIKSERKRIRARERERCKQFERLYTLSNTPIKTDLKAIYTSYVLERLLNSSEISIENCMLNY